MLFLDPGLLTWATISSAVVCLGSAVAGAVIAGRAKASTWFQYAFLTAAVLVPVSWIAGVVCWHIQVNCGGSAMNSRSVGTLVSHGNEVEVSTTLWRTVLFVEYLGYFSMLMLVLSIAFLFFGAWWHSRRI